MQRLMQRLMLGSLLALAAALPLNALAGDTLQRVVDFKVLKVGMSGNQPPMSMTNREGGMMGFDVDLAKALADAMKVKLEIVPMPFGELMKALQENAPAEEIKARVEELRAALSRYLQALAAQQQEKGNMPAQAEQNGDERGGDAHQQGHPRPDDDHVEH